MKIAIIGNGIAGTTAAIEIRKNSSHEINIISSESKNFFSRTALMYVYMGHMRFEDIQPHPDEFWNIHDINIIFNHVKFIDFQNKNLLFPNNEKLRYDKLILATGSNYNRFGWPGQDLGGVKGLYHYQDLEYLESRSDEIQHAVIVGGGLIGIELAEMLHSRQKSVSLLVREESYWDNVLPKEESNMISRHILEHGFDLRLSTNLMEINGDENSIVKAVKTDKGDIIPCQHVGLTAGVHPNIKLVLDGPVETNKGILVNEYLETNIPGVYAIGDCAEIRKPQPGRRNIEPVWYTGKLMGETVAVNILGEKKEYDPGIWYNSAKFLDIEYQVYGDVPNLPSEDQKSVYWEHPDGNKSIRINFNKHTNEVEGFNLMGVRYRHSVCDHWIKKKTDIREVLENLSLANFDPEFYPEYEASIRSTFTEQTGIPLKSKAKRNWDSVFTLIKGTK